MEHDLTPHTKSMQKRKHQKEVTDKKVKQKREQQGEAMRQRYNRQVKVENGAYVSVTIPDARDAPALSNGTILGCVIEQNKETMSVLVATEYGVLAEKIKAGGGRNTLRPARHACERFSPLSEHATVSEKLETIQKQIRSGTFDVKKEKLLTFPEALRQDGKLQTVRGKSKCGCDSRKKGCTKNCGCIRRKMPCTKVCGCSDRPDKCANPY
jgi:anti-sigma28 factor (negative regulator of flagellin synthesis)